MTGACLYYTGSAYSQVQASGLDCDCAVDVNTGRYQVNHYLRLRSIWQVRSDRRPDNCVDESVIPYNCVDESVICGGQIGKAIVGDRRK